MLNYRNFNLYIIFIAIFTAISIGANVPAVGANDVPLSGVDINIGQVIEYFISTNILEIFNKIIPSQSFSATAIKLFTALFLIDYMHCIAVAYMQGNYNSLVTTTCIKAFFWIAVTTAFKTSPVDGSPYFFAIPKELVSSVTSMPVGAVNWTWFSDTGAHNAVTEVMQKGILTQVDTFVNSVSNSLVNNPGFFKKGVFVVWILFLSMTFRYIYWPFLSISIGLMVKAFEWAIGLPIAFLMLAGKGHPQGEEYFNLGIQYIFYVALDFAIIMGIFAFGYQVVNQISTEMATTGTFGATVIGCFKIYFAILMLSGALLHAESIVAGIAGGAPKFTNAMGGSVLAIASSLAKSGNILSPIGAIKSGINSKNNGGNFFQGFKDHVMEKTFGKVEIDENGVRKRNYEKSLVGEIKGNTFNNLGSGYKVQEKKITVTDKITGLKKQKKVEYFGHSNSSGGQYFDQFNQWAHDKKTEEIQMKNFEKETGLSKKEMLRMGLVTKDSRDLFMKHHGQFKGMYEKLDSYGHKTHHLNVKTGGKAIKTMAELQKQHEDAKFNAENVFNSMEHKHYSSNSSQTKSFQNSLKYSNGNIKLQMKVLDDWLKEGSTNMKEFSINDYRKSLKMVEQNIVQSKSQKGLAYFKQHIEKQYNDMIVKSEKNELFTDIKDDHLREEANKALRVNLNQIQQNVKKIKI